MNRNLLILLITLFTIAGCNSPNTTTKDAEVNNPEKTDSPVPLEPGQASDSKKDDTAQVVEEPTVKKKVSTSVQPKEDTTEGKAISIDDALDVNKYKSVRDDPDYIGTPCKYVKGECIIHDHGNNGESPNNLEDDL
ncbi:MAG: hypothetical protein R3277_03870 [Brumimicrobium sp.]|nr:hypothetical protein [Brumimicrobium sp.]